MIQQLDQYQERQGLTDRELADRLNVTLLTLVNARRGRRLSLRRLAHQIGRHVPELRDAAAAFLFDEDGRVEVSA